LGLALASRCPSGENARAVRLRLRQDPALVPAAIEEMLRYDSPVQLTFRIATEDVEVGGRAVRNAQRP
jgi:cytochrome P450